MDTKLLGRWGEKTAEGFLQSCGFETLRTGYRTRYGEIDIIAKNSEYVVFAEVKLRKNGDFAAAREFVDRKKQDKIFKTASMWLQENETGLQPRFDVIEIYAPYGIKTAEPFINHIENAF